MPYSISDERDIEMINDSLVDSKLIGAFSGSTKRYKEYNGK